jgi:hypothetical protein
VPPSHIYNTDARSVGVADMITAIVDRRAARASGELAYHALEIMLSLEKSSKLQKRILLESTCKRPAPMPLGLSDGKVELGAE